MSPTGDVTGNLTNDCVFSHVYDAQNRLAAVFTGLPSLSGLVDQGWRELGWEESCTHLENQRTRLGCETKCVESKP